MTQKWCAIKNATQKRWCVLKNEAQNANANDKRKWMDACGNG